MLVRSITSNDYSSSTTTVLHPSFRGRQARYDVMLSLFRAPCGFTSGSSFTKFSKETRIWVGTAKLLCCATIYHLKGRCIVK